MKYIKQINSDNYNPELLEKIVTVTADPFKGHLPESVFVKAQMLTASGVWQEFFIEDNDNIVCSFRIMYKPGAHDDMNLLIGNVHTNSLYRKQGHISYLISETIKKYEMGHQFEGDNEGADAFIKKHLRSKSYWTLYSGVGEFYKRFGFEAVREMDWLVLTTRTEADGPVQYLPRSTEYFAKYIALPENPLHRSTNPEATTVENFWTVDDVVSEHLGHKYSCFGIRIPYGGQETVAIISGDLHYDGILVHLLYSNVIDHEVLDRHLARVESFLVQAFDDYKMEKHTNSFRASITMADIHGEKEYITEKLKKKWALDASQKDFLPMMKEFGSNGIAEGVKWVNNGFWCFG